MGETAQTLGLPTDYDYLLILPLFEAGFLQPAARSRPTCMRSPFATRIRSGD